MTHQTPTPDPVPADDPALSPEDQDLLAAVVMWARTNGWHPHEWLGWVNAGTSTDATLAVRVERVGGCGITVFHRPTPYDAWPVRGDFHQVATVREAVAVLVDQGILPPDPFGPGGGGTRYYLTAAAYAALGAL